MTSTRKNARGAGFLTGVLLPRYEVMLSRIALPALLGEIAIILWLVIMGAREQAVNSSEEHSS